MIEVVIWICGSLLALGGIACLVRVVKGPSILDRVLALDVMLLIISAALCLEMALNRHTDYLLFVVAACTIGFIGSVTVSRYVSDQRNA
ncbi:monovalent cation/H+ antiporter complex subunit F [Glutamicibacter protophormiae]|uniref:monovalent cation/H+ antiporter complex subunit F n=1 Tax=Glutamicibacter protophormiae TaxID=37930 RepID=UPI002A7F0F8D|nr:monovalent cation/H+ antiporter complex subunit F [Glutamicibacter protophormiae]WPR63860.1 monovalent cation/H+ antiporter complex subunit F [Glutamicibacter protophormiae]WPR67355.1 monovalent cation/H+ antiporter complex subunit F [Glutamicibacter protophormiae]